MKQNLSVLDTFIEIEPLDMDSFHKVRETLTRMGLASNTYDENDKRTLWQSCHVFHKQERYYIVHFKQLFQLDNRLDKTEFFEEDQIRTRLIAYLLESWKLIKCKVPIQKPETEISLVILAYADKVDFNLRAKYTIGKKRQAPDISL